MRVGYQECHLPRRQAGHIACAGLGVVDLLSVIFDHILSLEARVFNLTLYYRPNTRSVLNHIWYFYFARPHPLSQCPKSKQKSHSQNITRISGYYSPALTIWPFLQLY